MRVRTIARLVGIIAAAGSVANAMASGFQLLEQNASGLGNAYAGSAAEAENASVQFYNPAALTKLPGDNVSAGTTFIRPSFRFKDGGSTGVPASSNGQGGNAGDLATLPNFYASWQLSDRLFAGLGMGAPFGLKTEYDVNWLGQYQSDLFQITTYNVNPALAYKLNNRVSLGLGLDYQRFEIEFKRRAATLNALTQATMVTLDATGEAYGWNAGATVKLSETTDVGFSYRSKMFYQLGGTLKSDNQLVSPDVIAKANLTLPDTYIFSISQKLDERWTMLGDISRTNWSTIDQVAIMDSNGTVKQVLGARFRDTWRVALGGTYKINDMWKWKYGLAYDQTPVRSAEERLLSLPDNNRYWFSTGAQWQMDKQTTIDVGASYIYIPDAKVDANHSSQAQGHIIGSYEGNIVLFGVQLSRSF